MNIKYQLNRSVKALGLMAALLFATISVNAQCTISTANPPCVGQPINFFCGAVGASNYSWNFNSEGTNTTLCNPTFTFNSAGSKSVTLTLKLANGSTCNASITVIVKDAPKIDVKLLTADTACFFGNSFCFEDKTQAVANSSGPACIKSVKYLFSDGQLIKASGNPPNGVTMPNNFCKSFTNPAGGTYDMLVEIEDCNGCISRKNYPSICVVRASMGLTFSVPNPRPAGCDSVKLTVTNSSLIDIKDIDSFRWEWGDGTYTNSKSSWKPTASHTFKIQGPKAGEFDTKLTVWSKAGCKESYTFFSSAINIKLDPKIIASFDSVCTANPKIDFSIKGGSIARAISPVFNYGDPPTGPLNITRQWAGTHNFSGLGPYKIKFTYSHPICGNKEIYDTILVIGPQSVIEKAFNWLVDKERYQCVIKDTVKFKNFSVFYHNDRDFTDDDSVHLNYDSLKYDFIRDTLVNPKEPFDKNYMKWVKSKGGFNYPLTHVFKKTGTGQTSETARPQLRGNACVFRLWDFDDDFCEKCTTDTKKGVNAILKNCKYSKDTLPVHWYTPWDSIYQTRNSMIAANGIRYNKDSGQCFQIRIWPDDSMAIIRDTILYYGNNNLGISAKDSVIFKNIKNKIKVPSFIAGPAKWDATNYAPRFYLRKSDTIYIDNNNGFPPNLVKGSTTKYQTLQLGQTLIIANKTDTARFNYWIVYIQDTIANNLVKPWHKVWKRERMLSYKKTDSINAAVHRQRFYEGTTVRCFNVRLFHKDLCHKLQCEHQATASLALMPPSAKKLRKEGVLCLGSGPPTTYGITFILSDTKPGCTRTIAKINFDTALSKGPKNGWEVAIGPNLSGGTINTGNLPPVNPPYLGYALMGPAPSRFSKIYTSGMIKDSITGYIHVGLIVGNGIWRDPNSPPQDDLNYPSSCIDTIYYPKFARFPILDGAFRIIKPKENANTDATNTTKICRKDTLCMTLMPKNKTYIPDVQEVNWRLQASNVGKYYNQGYTLNVNEIYERFTKDPKDSTHLLDYLYILKTSSFDPTGTKTLDSQVILVKEVKKWHTEADITPVFDVIKQILAANNIDVYELSPAQLSEIIWNGKGKFGKPYTGSRGCLDTTGFGSFIRFYKVADVSVIKHFRDTSLLPVDSIIGHDAKKYRAYCFVPQYSGYYVAQFSLRSTKPENCAMSTGAKTVIVGFFARADFNDTILCHGSDVEAYTEFRYFHVDPNNCPCTLDPTDYWFDRRSQAGLPNREGKTRWDLSKADDDTANKSKTIFGSFPYGQTGVGTGTFPSRSPLGYASHRVKLGGISIPGAIYYLSDTGGYYNIRVSTADSMGCKDTLSQDIYVTAVKAKFNLDQKRPECNTIIEYFDSSFVYDPCKWKLDDECDKIIKWTINWGDSSRSAKNVFFTDPNQIGVGHDFTRNGNFKVILKVETMLGCVDYDTMDVYIPGPIPFFDTFIPRKYCVNEKVDFTNLSKYVKQDSSIWQWDFGDLSFDNQYDTILKTNPGKNDTINHRYPKPGRYKIFLHQYFVLKLGSLTKKCHVVWPDTTNGQMKPFYVDIFPYDSVWLTPKDTSVCLNEPVTVNAHVQPYLKYKQYVWNDTTGFNDTTRVFSYRQPGVYTIKFKGDANSVDVQKYGKVCPAEDSIKITVALVKADFDIDSSGAPVYCFENKSTNSVDNRWSLFNKQDIKTVNPGSARILEFQITGKDGNEPKPCRDYRDSLGAYWVCLEATNGNGCKDTICKLLINRFEANIRPPNVFTPNKDPDGFTGLDKENLEGNNVFNIEIKGEEKYDLVIYDRWGVRVFESQDSKVDWNGKIKNTGKDCPDGTYFYILKYRYKGLDKDEPVLNGTVQIIR